MWNRIEPWRDKKNQFKSNLYPLTWGFKCFLFILKRAKKVQMNYWFYDKSIISWGYGQITTGFYRLRFTKWVMHTFKRGYASIIFRIIRWTCLELLTRAVQCWTLCPCGHLEYLRWWYNRSWLNMEWTTT